MQQTKQQSIEIESKISSEESMYYEKEDISKSLEECKNKNLFLFKIGLLLCVFFSSGLLVNVLLLFDIQKLNEYFFLKFLLTFTAAQILFKRMPMFISKKTNTFFIFYFIFDIITYVFFNLGIFFYLDTYRQYYQDYKGHIIFILNFTFLADAISFTLSTLLQKNKQKYNFWVGVVINRILEFSAYLAMIKIFPELPHNMGLFIKINIFNFFYTFYFCHQVHFIVKYKSSQYKEDDYFKIFYDLWNDWTYDYWINLQKDLGINQKRKKTKKNHKKKQKV